MTIDEARRQLISLQMQLHNASSKDPEQEVRGIAVPVLDVILAEAKKAIPASAVVAGVADAFTMQMLENEPVRAVDALVVVSALLEALPQL